MGRGDRRAGWGGTVAVQVDTDARLWRRWDAAAGRWDRLPAGGRLLVARGLGDVRAALAV